MDRINFERGEYRVGPGASSLLMIFVALCMTTVGILTLISALADTRLTERSERHVQQYYAASAEAQRTFSRIDAKLKLLRDDANGDLGAYEQALYNLTDDEQQLTVEPGLDGEINILFATSMYDENEVFVQLAVPISLSGPRYRVVKQVMQNTADWQPDSEGLQLLIIEE